MKKTLITIISVGLIIFSVYNVNIGFKYSITEPIFSKPITLNMIVFGIDF